MYTRFLILLLTVLFTGQILAQTSSLIVFSEDGERFSLVLNGIQQNADPQTNVKITDLNAPSYKLKILFEDALQPMDKMVYFQEPSEATYVIKQNKKGNYVMRFMNTVPIAQAPTTVAPQQNVIVYTTVTPPASNSVTITESSTTSIEESGSGENVNMGISISEDGMDFNMNVNVNDNTGGENVNTSSTTTTTTTTIGQTSPQSAETTVMASGSCIAPMNDYDFREAMNSISSKTFEDSKMTMAKQITKANCFLSTQVKSIMETFDFEDSKLDFAKFAYPYTFDQNKYYVVNNAFEFETSIDELNDAIGR